LEISAKIRWDFGNAIFHFNLLGVASDKHPIGHMLLR